MEDYDYMGTNNELIVISKDFSKTPGARYQVDGEFSGEDFRERLLKPAIERAIKKKTKVIVDFDGGYGYPTSFLEEAFGGLVRGVGCYSAKQILDVLEFVSMDEPSLITEVRNYIDPAGKEGKK